MQIFDTKKGDKVLFVEKGGKILNPGYFLPQEYGEIIEPLPGFYVLQLKPQDEVSKYIEGKDFDCVVVITPPYEEPNYLYKKK